MNQFEHQRHKPPERLERARELVLVCAPMRSNVNLSHIARLAGCCGVGKIFCTGQGKLDRKIARDGADAVVIEVHRSLAPVLDKLRDDSFRLIGLEQTTNSTSLHEYAFERRTALVIGNERTGLTGDILSKLDDVVEIPVWGMPFSYNVATATTMAVYEYCKQYPNG